MLLFYPNVLSAILETMKPKYIVEIGADRGHNTLNLVHFASQNEATMYCIDPKPNFDPEAMWLRYGNCFQMRQGKSLDVLPLLPAMDLVLIDGDHNWYTVYHELKLIETRCLTKNEPFPLCLFHDVGWPYARRDLYYNPDDVPEEHRQPYRKQAIHPDLEELSEIGGINPNLCNAVLENGPKNGVLTAVEDFFNESPYYDRLIEIPGFYGLGILVPRDMAERNPALAELLKSFDLPPALKAHFENLERERIYAAMQIPGNSPYKHPIKIE